jgi:glutamate synthase domain-containing protein 3
MLRPQVFAWQENILEDGTKAAIGFAASEKQGIDAALESLSEVDPRFWTRADRYWNARGGSHTDGGAFFYRVKQNGKGMDITCTDKFGRQVFMPTHTPAFHSTKKAKLSSKSNLPSVPGSMRFDWFKDQVANWEYAQLIDFLATLEENAVQGNQRDVIELLTLMMDRRYDTGKLRRSSVLSLIDETFARVIESLGDRPSGRYRYLRAGDAFPESTEKTQTVVMDARGFTPQDETSVAIAIQKLYKKGFREFLVAFTKGHRFIGNGLGPGTTGTRIDVYGSPGDYLASGSDGLEIHVHNNGQDQLAQIMKSGKLVVYGDVGQTFMYAAKGGEVYVLGNAAGRPLINAVGRPRVVINGTCLDYLAESFMAGDPLNGGGFVILNGITFDEHNQIVDMDSPYPGGNLFSLASGGAIYVRDPNSVVTEDQLNGGEFAEFTPKDWDLIEPYLRENTRLFGIPIGRLLSFKGEAQPPIHVYRKIKPRAVRALMAEESWVTLGKK